MNSLERKKLIEQKCHEKNINLETQEYIKQYISLNETLFGSILDIDDVVQNTLENLNNSINRFSIKNIPLRTIYNFFSYRGMYLYDRKSIYINFIYRILGKFNKKINNDVISTIMHELDHCATYEDIPISEQEKNKIIKDIIEKYNISSPKQMDKVRNYINKTLICHSIFGIDGIKTKKRH